MTPMAEGVTTVGAGSTELNDKKKKKNHVKRKRTKKKKNDTSAHETISCRRNGEMYTIKIIRKLRIEPG